MCLLVHWELKFPLTSALHILKVSCSECGLPHPDSWPWPHSAAGHEGKGVCVCVRAWAWQLACKWMYVILHGWFHSGCVVMCSVIVCVCVYIYMVDQTELSYFSKQHQPLWLIVRAAWPGPAAQFMSQTWLSMLLARCFVNRISIPTYTGHAQRHTKTCLWRGLQKGYEKVELKDKGILRQNHCWNSCSAIFLCTFFCGLSEDSWYTHLILALVFS